MREREPVTARALSWLGVDADWERVPADAAGTARSDALLAGLLTAWTVLGIELMRSIGYFEGEEVPAWGLYLLAVAGVAPLAWRRRFPLGVLAVVYTHFLAVGLTVPMVTQELALQVTYFVALYTAVAWARDRRAMLVVVGAALLAMFGWLAWQLAVGSGIDTFLRSNGLDERTGTVSPFVAIVMQTWMLNLAYFAGAILVGQTAWHAAHRRETLREQTVTIARQSDELQRRAVVSERLRIARELHDVVAHHVSVIGIQAAAARRLVAADPAAAAAPLSTIEGASREAVQQMRGLLGTLREVDEALPSPRGERPGEAAVAAPEPGLADVPRLAEVDDGLAVTVTVVEQPDGAAAGVPAPVGLSLYRTAQEALANVRRHSTARSAGVVVRVERPAAGARTIDAAFPHGFAEVEVLDAGRPRAGSSGSGLGLLGVRERVSTHGGVAEIGPRVTGGYRVRVRLPLPEECP
ncbi:sensor histidine kinase [Xylanimonas oleitrophica]|uniref:histidine kinase n=1 Tax=Xylanimonas oleitrophica TaxID=2607479 RepID=A0A2W5XTI8_9MICO|nr:histidine kinase [Xylanimonas oleitrophica]PZR53398.1 sensor histidine kinase [Xylanimonas oleitrophica]